MENNIKPWTIVFIGPTASGKSTLGSLLYDEVQNKFNKTKFYDGDAIRKKLKNEYSHCLSDRFRLLDEYMEIIFDDYKDGYNVILSTVLHKNKMQEKIKRELDNVFLIYLECNINLCEKRDFKGHYARARNGELNCFPGITEPYEYPSNADLIVNTGKYSIPESLNFTLGFHFV